MVLIVIFVLFDFYLFFFKEIVLGSFRLKSNSDDENDLALSTGSFFQKQKNSEFLEKPPTKVSMAVAARTALGSPKPLVYPSTSSESSKTINISTDRRAEVSASLLSSPNIDKPKNIFPKMKNERPKKNVLEVDNAVSLFVLFLLL